MSMTLKLNVSFPMTIVVMTVSVSEFQVDRQKIREMPAEKLAVLKGRTKANAEMFLSDRTDEQIFEIIYRAGLRELIREEVLREISGSESDARVGDIKVSFETFQKPEVCTCDGVTTGCSRCPGKRWTETV